MKMKNLVIALVAILLAGGCKKATDELPAPNVTGKLNATTLLTQIKEKVSVENGLLVFEDRATYERAIDYLTLLESTDKDLLTHWDNQLGFNSLNQQKTEKELSKLGILDPILAELLNSEQKIQIENDIFEIDILNENVNVSNLGSNKTETFSTDDNYFDIKDGITTERGAKALCPNKEKGITLSDATAKVVYQRAGIYFSLQSKIKKSYWGGALISLQSLSGSFYTKNTSSATAQNIAVTYKGGTGREYSFRPYYGTKRLKAYNFRLQFGYSLGGNQIMKWSTISC